MAIGVSGGLGGVSGVCSSGLPRGGLSDFDSPGSEGKVRLSGPEEPIRHETLTKSKLNFGPQANQRRRSSRGMVRLQGKQLKVTIRNY